ncbi:hypothetical protein, partial [Janthinobacterium agaricidamnosum]|uniref:hypothetical protein n=1 Tax=Janthinobacterium agaricidamnosum TaxID=55508 RepID=UPI001C3F4967
APEEGYSSTGIGSTCAAQQVFRGFLIRCCHFSAVSFHQAVSSTGINKDNKGGYGYRYFDHR